MTTTVGGYQGMGEALIVELCARARCVIDLLCLPILPRATVRRSDGHHCARLPSTRCLRNQGRYTLVFLTNHLTFGATTIAAIYKDRWQVELFFKALKQNLKIKTFVGTSPNALKIQVWTALIAILLLKYLHLRARFAWSLANLVALLRMNLFTHRDLWAWLDQPFHGPPTVLIAAQAELDLG
jgi:Transposase DDE domain